MNEQTTLEKVKARFEQLAEEMQENESLCPLYVHYQGQQYPQGVYLCIYPDVEKIKFDYDAEIGNAMLMIDYHNMRYRIPFSPNTTRQGFVDWLEQDRNAKAVAKIIDGFREVWKGFHTEGEWSFCPSRLWDPQDVETADVRETLDWLGGMWNVEWYPADEAAVFEGIRIQRGKEQEALESLKLGSEDNGVFLRDLSVETLKQILNDVECEYKDNLEE